MDSQDWQRRYADKMSTAEEAIHLIRPGRRILIGLGAAEPVALVKAMVEKGDHLADNEVVHLMTLGPATRICMPTTGRGWSGCAATGHAVRWRWSVCHERRTAASPGA